VQGLNALELQVHGALPSELSLLLSSVRRMFDLTADPSRVSDALSNDPLLRALIAQRPGLRIPGVWDPFECAVRGIIGQQFSVSAARTQLGRLVERFGAPIRAGLSGATHLFPAPTVLAEANMDTLGLTSSRRDALRRLARGVCDKSIRFDAPSEEISRMLCALPGVGRWTAGYVELRGLGEPDALPFGDLLLRRLVSGGKKALTPLALESKAEAWRPFRGYGVFHLWAAAQSPGITRRRATS
jgi:AraC family transcriptional regulator of adaptative response / DNA-3-methyladenine glycosylase II